MSTTGMQTENPRLDALNAKLRENSLSGHWLRDGEPRPKLQPRVWPWAVIYECLEESGEVVALGGAGEATNRRTVQIVNPALKSTARTFQVSVQLVKPGEIAECHRHTFNAMRFVVESGGMYTTAEGEPQIMESGDLLIQPGWAWHDHTNNTNEPGIWLDLHDNPLVGYLDSMFSDRFAEGPVQPLTKPPGYSQQRFGTVRPRTTPVGNRALPYSYKWRDVLASLESQDSAGESDPYDGVLLEYTNPVTGGPTLPTIGCWVQMLRPGETTRPHRHTASTLYHTVEGKGVTILGKGTTEELSWGEKDCFFVPPWAWHQHRNASSTERAILFSVTDRSLLETVGFYREEQG